MLRELHAVPVWRRSEPGTPGVNSELLLRRACPKKETRRRSRPARFRFRIRGSGLLRARMNSVLLGDAHQPLLDVLAAEGRANLLDLRHLRLFQGKPMGLQRILGTVDEPPPKLGMLDRPPDDRPDHFISHTC